MKSSFITQSKKAMSIGDIYPLVLTIAVSGILIAIMLYMFTAWQRGVATETTLVTNETLSSVTAAGEVVTTSTTCGFNTFTLGLVTNATDGTQYTSDNYTSNIDTGRVSIVNASTINNTNINVSYTYKYGEESCTSMQTLTTQFVAFLPWIGIILLIVAAAIVLGIVISSFAGRKGV